MKERIASAIAVFLVCSCFPVYSQSAPPSGAPRSMRLCVARDCATLTWNGTRYDAVRDGQNVVWAFYTISQWQPDRVEMYGESLKNEPNTAFHVKGNFVGKMVSADKRLVQGDVAWQTGPASGKLPYKITWEGAQSALSASPVSRQPATNNPYLPQKAVQISMAQRFTDTGISVSSGQKLMIKVRGAVNFFTGGCPEILSCIAGPSKSIAKIGENGSEISLGDSRTFIANASGELFVGFDDTYLGDNSGGLIATVYLNPIERVPVREAPVSTQNPPPVMHFCAANCFTLTWNGSEYVRTPIYDWEGANHESRWTVESFTPASVIIHRIEALNGVKGMDTTYHAQVSPEGDSLINVSEKGPDPFVRFTWGSALGATPGNNDERDRELIANGITPNPATPVMCTAEAMAKVSPDDAWGAVQRNLKAKDYTDCYCWLMKAVENGKAAGALTFYGQLYARGIGVLQNYQESSRAFKQAAEMGNPDGQYELMRAYYFGFGVQEDRAASEYWRNKAMESEGGRKLVEEDHQRAIKEQKQAGAASDFLDALFGLRTTESDQEWRKEELRRCLDSAKNAYYKEQKEIQAQNCRARY